MTGDPRPPNQTTFKTFIWNQDVPLRDKCSLNCNNTFGKSIQKLHLSFKICYARNIIGENVIAENDTMSMHMVFTFKRLVSLENTAEIRRQH